MRENSALVIGKVSGPFKCKEKLENKLDAFPNVKKAECEEGGT